MKGVSVLGNIKALAGGQVYEFLIAAVTNYHTYNGFKQYAFSSGSQKSAMGLTGLKYRCR